MRRHPAINPDASLLVRLDPFLPLACVWLSRSVGGHRARPYGSSTPGAVAVFGDAPVLGDCA